MIARKNSTEYPLNQYYMDKQTSRVHPKSWSVRVLSAGIVIVCYMRPENRDLTKNVWK